MDSLAFSALKGNFDQFEHSSQEKKAT